MPFDPGHPIRIAEAHAENRAVLAYLRRAESSRAVPLSARPGDAPDPYYGLGTHPDIVEQLWDRLGAALPTDARCIVAGAPALAEPASGLVVAVALGTTYAIRLAPADIEAGREAGLPASHHYSSVGEVLDLSAWGPGWCFGRFDAREHQWLVATCVHAARLGDRAWIFAGGAVPRPQPPTMR